MAWILSEFKLLRRVIAQFNSCNFPDIVFFFFFKKAINKTQHVTPDRCTNTGSHNYKHCGLKKI